MWFYNTTYSFNYAFWKIIFIVRKQIVSEHRINQSIDIYRYLSNSLIISPPILQVSTSLQDFLHVWFKFSFLYYVLCKRTGITLLVIFRCHVTWNIVLSLGKKDIVLQYIIFSFQFLRGRKMTLSKLLLLSMYFRYFVIISQW